MDVCPSELAITQLPQSPGTCPTVHSFDCYYDGLALTKRFVIPVGQLQAVDGHHQHLHDKHVHQRFLLSVGRRTSVQRKHKYALRMISSKWEGYWNWYTRHTSSKIHISLV